MKVALTWLVALLLCLAGGVFTALLVVDLRDADGACARQVPEFEGVFVEDAQLRWPPPVVRCRLVDRDPEAEGAVSEDTAWGWTDLLVVAGLDMSGTAMLAVGVVRWRRRRPA